MKIQDFKKRKQEASKISMLTCYDYPSACTIAQSHIDCVLVGDSVAMAVHGHPNTLMADINMMVLHTKAVSRGLKQQFLISDLPFLSHKMAKSNTLMDVKTLMQAGAQAIKIEGGDKQTCQRINYLVEAGIPVIGHIGLTPQQIHKLGGYIVQGKNKEQAEVLLQQALNLEEAGCFALVIECVPHQLATSITQALSIPTIGIGAGVGTDGQVLVWQDMLGLQPEFKPKFVKHYLDGQSLILDAINAYASEVKLGQFPFVEHAF